MTTTAYEIPLDSDLQTFQVSLNGTTYQIRLLWNYFEGGWFIDLQDTSGNAIIGSMPLVTGADLLEQFAYENFGVHLVVQTDHDVFAVPTYDNIGVTSHLYSVVVS